MFYNSQVTHTMFPIQQKMTVSPIIEPTPDSTTPMIVSSELIKNTIILIAA